MANIVAIVGRPNVGKSTLFNRLVEMRDAIMDNVSGVTRDRHYGKAEWQNKTFTVIDTGGYVVGSEDIFEGAIREQVEIAIQEASVILFVVDGRDGLTGLDSDFANVLRRSKKPVLVVVNKAETIDLKQGAGEFYEMGFGDVFPISAINGSGTGELLEEVSKYLLDETKEDDQEIPRIAIVGRPNAGKSSLVNALLGKPRTIVTDIPGTTRDAVDAEYNLFGKRFILTDTAGIRRKTRVKENIEFYSILRSINAIEKSDVCVIVVDASLGFDAQDVNILHLAIKNKKGCVIVMNKWDIVEKDHKTAKKIEDEIRSRLNTLSFVPIIFASALTKQRIHKVVEKAVEVFENKKRKIPTSQLNEVMLKEIEKYPPPAERGRIIKIKYITQLPTHNPTFAFFANHPKFILESYERYLENRMRENFNFEGVPIKLVFRDK
ncbi:MAG: ribosome biogenesis GTPase Der [Flammeovirgaceae bacterium]